jgi:hypothetical protein
MTGMQEPDHSSVRGAVWISANGACANAARGLHGRTPACSTYGGSLAEKDTGARCPPASKMTSGKISCEVARGASFRRRLAGLMPRANRRLRCNRSPLARGANKR